MDSPGLKKDFDHNTVVHDIIRKKAEKGTGRMSLGIEEDNKKQMNRAEPAKWRLISALYYGTNQKTIKKKRYSVKNQKNYQIASMPDYQMSFKIVIDKVMLTVFFSKVT